MFSRMLGLIGKRRLESGQAILIYPCQQIHTYFMKFSIDCIFIDQQYRIVEMIEGLTPWKISNKIPHAWGVLELSTGSIKATEAQVNDILKIK